MSDFTLSEVQERTYKSKDAWWTVYLVDPLASRLVVVAANRTSLTPNQLTLAALALGLGAAGCFAMASWPWLLAGALLFHLSFVLDCMDGKVARLKGNGTIFGSWLDYVFDRLRVLVCALALMGSQYVITGDQTFIWFAFGIVATDMFRYLNGPQMAKVRSGMRKRIARAIREAEQTSENEGQTALALREGHRLTSTLTAQQNDEVVDPEEGHGADREGDGTTYATASHPREESATQGTSAEVTRVQATELQRRFFTRFPWYAHFRDGLMRRRVRPHLVSGIEFQMGTFIIAPIVGTVSTPGMLAVIALSAAGMLAFEALLVYKLWLSTKEFTRVVEAIEAASPPVEDADAPATTGTAETQWEDGDVANATVVATRQR
ncbi:CDP-alcohol phosphatidyltransferase family protein [Halostreptopolyspora alba]|uniref:CDP-alcohol phosphatidyltransferase family protein n=1 Tax=Halostreptopolyspora alba TaxID=2487137 RepID=A0A3N0E5C8_9ACTN|nr:CDP-alcohol phosphatidyltransferase family protein [Nocardiopsaceae bacterium YIM 96095]